MVDCEIDREPSMPTQALKPFRLNGSSDYVLGGQSPRTGIEPVDMAYRRTLSIRVTL